MPVIFNRKELLLAFVLSLAPYSNADLVTFENRKVQYTISDMEEKEALALIGESKEQLEIASIYYDGKNGVKKDFDKAFYWYELAAKNDNPKAQNKLGYFYITGENVTKNATKAFEYFQKSALNGNSPAQANLGQMYLGNLGIPQNYELALHWFKKASDQDNKIAPFYIAHMYEHGLGLSKSIVEAKKWYEISSSRGYQPATDKILVFAINESNPNDIDLMTEEKNQYDKKLRNYHYTGTSNNEKLVAKYVPTKDSVKNQSEKKDSKKAPPKKTYQSKNSATHNSVKSTAVEKNQSSRPLIGIERFSKEK